jgi:hypothetical protein
MVKPGKPQIEREFPHIPDSERIVDMIASVFAGGHDPT